MRIKYLALVGLCFGLGCGTGEKAPRPSTLGEFFDRNLDKKIRVSRFSGNSDCQPNDAYNFALFNAIEKLF